MPTRFSILFISLLICSGVELNAQQYLVLQKRGTAKNFKYQSGNRISLQTVRGDFSIAGEITEIKGTSFIVNGLIEVELDNIAYVSRKSNFLNRLSTLFFIRGGVAYFLIDGTNRTINKEYPVIDESTMLISGAMIGTGLAMRPLITRKFDLSKKWRLKILDFDDLKQAG